MRYNYITEMDKGQNTNISVKSKLCPSHSQTENVQLTEPQLPVTGEQNSLCSVMQMVFNYRIAYNYVFKF